MFGFECFSQHGVPRVHERCISLIQFVQHHSHPELRLSDSESVSLGESTWERAILPFPSISTDSLILHQDFATFQKFQIVRIAMTCNDHFIFFIPLDPREDQVQPNEITFNAAISACEKGEMLLAASRRVQFNIFNTIHLQRL